MVNSARCSQSPPWLKKGLGPKRRTHTACAASNVCVGKGYLLQMVLCVSKTSGGCFCVYGIDFNQVCACFDDNFCKYKAELDTMRGVRAVRNACLNLPFETRRLVSANTQLWRWRSWISPPKGVGFEYFVWRPGARCPTDLMKIKEFYKISLTGCLFRLLCGIEWRKQVSRTVISPKGTLLQFLALFHFLGVQFMFIVFQVVNEVLNEQTETFSNVWCQGSKWQIQNCRTWCLLCVVPWKKATYLVTDFSCWWFSSHQSGFQENWVFGLSKTNSCGICCKLPKALTIFPLLVWGKVEGWSAKWLKTLEFAMWHFFALV